ncbi:hypothetical protein BD626DRAFT_535198 [Schizophyllum amplum]|uniref:Uncharacterized protein n=1 Tax=Schizophyllum amplum TaxID=97359 RepID=A0A550CR75_9AGAR|nr:hypothetical protein BD626DRAFT_535198 [Auriculariopsis ampla]
MSISTTPAYPFGEGGKFVRLPVGSGLLLIRRSKTPVPNRFRFQNKRDNLEYDSDSDIIPDTVDLDAVKESATGDVYDADSDTIPEPMEEDEEEPEPEPKPKPKAKSKSKSKSKSKGKGKGKGKASSPESETDDEPVNASRHTGKKHKSGAGSGKARKRPRHDGNPSDADSETDSASELDPADAAEIAERPEVRLSEKMYCRMGFEAKHYIGENPADYAVLRAPYVDPARLKKNKNKVVTKVDGAYVGVFVRVPGDIPEDVSAQSDVYELSRYPELMLKVVPATKVVKKVYNTLCRIAEVRGDELCWSADENGKMTPLLVPLEHNDLWSRFTFTGDSVANYDEPKLICMKGDDECIGEVPHRWSANRWEYVRLCVDCPGGSMWHIQCLVTVQGFVDLEDEMADIMSDAKHTHLRYLFSDKVTARVMPRFLDHGFGDTVENNDDIHDTLGLYHLPDEITWEEIAALPIKRKAFAGCAPASIEMCIVLARKRVQEGRGGEAVPPVGQWVPDLTYRQGSCRAVVILLNAHLRVLRKRGMKGQRWFHCPACHAYI